MAASADFVIDSDVETIEQTARFLQLLVTSRIDEVSPTSSLKRFSLNGNTGIQHLID